MGIGVGGSGEGKFISLQGCAPPPPAAMPPLSHINYSEDD